MCGLQRSGINSSDVEILTLTNVTEEDAGEYICKVSNYIGQASQSGWLTVIPGNHWDLTPTCSPSSPSVAFRAPSLTCCVVMVLLVVSWLSWGSQTFSTLMSDPCVSAWCNMEALVGPAHLDTDIVTATILLWIFRCRNLTKAVWRWCLVLQCSPCSLSSCMYSPQIVE